MAKGYDKWNLKKSGGVQEDRNGFSFKKMKKYLRLKVQGMSNNYTIIHRLTIDNMWI